MSGPDDPRLHEAVREVFAILDRYQLAEVAGNPELPRTFVVVGDHVSRPMTWEGARNLQKGLLASDLFDYFCSGSAK